MDPLRGIAALLLGLSYSACVGLLAAIGVGLAIFAMPFAWAWDGGVKAWTAIQRNRRLRAPTRH